MVAQDLNFFMSLAGEQDYVTRFRRFNRKLDSGGAVGLDDAICRCLANPNERFSDDRIGVFGARIVAGQHNKITSLTRCPAHLRSLRPVTVAAAAKERDDATLVRRDDTPESLTQRADELMYQSKQNGRNRVTVG